MKAYLKRYEQTVAGARKAIKAGDTEAAESILRKLPGEGGVVVKHELAILLKDMRNPKAITWMQKAAAQGYTPAENDLGAIYYVGELVPCDMSKAVSLFKSAAEKGLPRAMFNMGIVYDGTTPKRHVKKSFREAARWYQKAVDAGHGTAMCNLGYLYETGHGVRKDYKKAMSLYLRSARKGVAIAEGSVGRLCADGRGVKQSNKTAAKWLIDAWEHGWKDAGDCMNDLLQKTHDPVFSGDWDVDDDGYRVAGAE